MHDACACARDKRLLAGKNEALGAKWQHWQLNFT
jgi:hypothetical protein